MNPKVRKSLEVFDDCQNEICKKLISDKLKKAKASGCGVCYACEKQKECNEELKKVILGGTKE